MSAQLLVRVAPPAAGRPLFGPTSVYAELVWLPVLGPATFLLWRHLVRRFELQGPALCVELEGVAAALGLGGAGTNQSVIGRSLRRIERFGVATTDASEVLHLRPQLPPVSDRELRRLHPVIAKHHQRLLASTPAAAPPPATSHQLHHRHQTVGVLARPSRSSISR